MSTTTKRKRSKTRKLADYLAGKGPLPHEFFSMGNLTGALLKLRTDEDIDAEDIDARVKRILRSHHGFFQEHNLVTRALKIRARGQPLLYALMTARNERARRQRRPSRKPFRQLSQATSIGSD